MSAKVLLMLVMASFLLSACNTVEGLGKDIEKTADWTRNHMP
jgi:predicted small secreted protein